MKFTVVGANGRMGRLISFLLEEKGFCVFRVDNSEDVCKEGEIQPQMQDLSYEVNINDGVISNIELLKEAPDVIIDFSYHTSIRGILDYATKNGIPLVIGTTGHTQEEKAMIKKASETVPIFVASNFSFGMHVFRQSSAQMASRLCDWECEIEEIHHSGKKDAPSGSAISLAEEIIAQRNNGKIVFNKSAEKSRNCADVGITSIRMAKTIGKHTVILDSGDERITVIHEVTDRAVFAEGAIKAALFIKDKTEGLYGMDSL